MLHTRVIPGQETVLSALTSTVAGGLDTLGSGAPHPPPGALSAFSPPPPRRRHCSSLPTSSSRSPLAAIDRLLGFIYNRVVSLLYPNLRDISPSLISPPCSPSPTNPPACPSDLPLPVPISEQLVHHGKHCWKGEHPLPVLLWAWFLGRLSRVCIAALTSFTTVSSRPSLAK